MAHPAHIVTNARTEATAMAPIVTSPGIRISTPPENMFQSAPESVLAREGRRARTGKGHPNRAEGTITEPESSEFAVANREPDPMPNRS
ncbi:hypothetical protein NN3_27750 [Nocardia neocaledoniensis NBRC 108232]|nr:hypothetical protein NN3_27750 [Nocardia neocaledoniensis NBRC 108232]